jgi:hypothetical protein
MDQPVGDRLIVHSNRVGQPPRQGEIVEVIGGGRGGTRYRVRWADGRESIVLPGSDAVVKGSPEHRPAGPETRTVAVELRVEEDSEHCEAIATMRTSTDVFTGSGRARRNPADPMVPMIGEELAIARSLGDLAAKLEKAANRAIASHESRPLHLIP